MENVRSLEALWPFRRQRHLVVACLDVPTRVKAIVDVIAELRAELLVEREVGPLSAALGRPSVTVASRFWRVGWRGPSAELERVLAELESFELACPECGPQAWGDPGGLRAEEFLHTVGAQP